MLALQDFDCAQLCVGWRSGLFVCGERPLWLLAVRGTLVAHPMTVEGAVLGFTPFHNINCPRVRGPDALNIQAARPCLHMHATKELFVSSKKSEVLCRASL